MKLASCKNRVLCLWLPNWPLQRVRLVRPELRHRELILYASHRGCLRVMASSKRAIPLGMPLAEAKALVVAHFEEHDPHADQAALLQLAAWCEQFSPIVGIEQPDNLCFNVTGLGPLFGGEQSLAQQVLRAFQQRGCMVQLTIADTLGAAWAVSHYGKEFPMVVLPDQMMEILAILPVNALRLHMETDILAELGIHRIGQLLSLPRDALAVRFDPQLLRRLDQATGLLTETIVSHRPPPEITADSQLEYSTDNKQTIEIILSQLTEGVTQKLIERQQGVIQLECQLRCETGQTVNVIVSLFRASADAKHLLGLTLLKLERTVLPRPIIGVRLAVLAAAPLQTWQQELFEPSHREQRREVRLLVDRLSNRLGRESVVRAVPQAEVQPELAFRYEPLAGAVKGKTKPYLWKTLPRPLRLEKEPIPLEVLSVVPNGPPIQFEYYGSHRISHAKGPERIQTGWWRGRYVQRDYYRIETSMGRRFWLFRRLVDDKWFLHGTFD